MNLMLFGNQFRLFCQADTLNGQQLRNREANKSTGLQLCICVSVFKCLRIFNLSTWSLISTDSQKLLWYSTWPLCWKVLAFPIKTGYNHIFPLVSQCRKFWWGVVDYIPYTRKTTCSRCLVPAFSKSFGLWHRNITRKKFEPMIPFFARTQRVGKKFFSLLDTSHSV